jgi:Leucine-rich repeat (LRR) protein
MTVRTEEQKYLYIHIMIVRIVLLIVILVQVNSQELCPSVCECNDEQATCTDLFSDVTSITQGRFYSGLRVLRVTGSTRLELDEYIFLRWSIMSLTTLDVSKNNIKKIRQRAFDRLFDLQYLDLSSNNITTLDSETFYSNVGLTL